MELKRLGITPKFGVQRISWKFGPRIKVHQIWYGIEINPKEKVDLSEQVGRQTKKISIILTLWKLLSTGPKSWRQLTRISKNGGKVVDSANCKRVHNEEYSELNGK